MLNFLHKFPYSNFHEINLDWIINTVKSFSGTIDQMQDQIDEAEAYMKDNIESTTIEVINKAIQDGAYNVGIRYTAADERLDIIITEA